MLIMQSCSEGNPDLLFVNGKIHTMDSAGTIVEAIAVKDGKILETGTTSGLREKYSGINEIDLSGKVVLPGFIDAEGSIVEYSKNLNVISLVTAKSLDDILEQVREKVKDSPPGSWIAGFGWSEFVIPVEELQKINKTLLDSISTEHNIYLINLAGNTVWVNSKLLESAGINRDTKSPDNGIIEFDSNGDPTGLLFDGALELVRNKIPELTDDQIRKFVIEGVKELNKWGFVGIQDRTVGTGTLNLFKELIDSNILPIRVYAVLSAGYPAFEEYLEKGMEKNYKDRLTIRSVSLDYDGGLEFQQAIMEGKYLNETSSPEPYNGQGEIENVFKRALEKNFQVRVKAVGDKAIKNVLDVIDKVSRDLNMDGSRTVIEHIEFTDEEILKRFKEHKLIPSVRPDIGMSDMQIVSEFIGAEYLNKIANWRSIKESCGMFVSGTDFPFHQINPFIQIYYLTQRKFIGENQFNVPNTAQVVSLDDAIRSFTIWSTYSCFQEEDRGTIEKGKYADMIVLSEDIFSDPEKLLSVKVEKTILGGEVVFEN